MGAELQAMRAAYPEDADEDVQTTLLAKDHNPLILIKQNKSGGNKQIVKAATTMRNFRCPGKVAGIFTYEMSTVLLAVTDERLVIQTFMGRKHLQLHVPFDDERVAQMQFLAKQQKKKMYFWIQFDAKLFQPVNYTGSVEIIFQTDQAQELAQRIRQGMAMQQQRLG